jgi:hypothetical protein
MKISDEKYIKVSPEDGSRFSHDFTEFKNIPTKSDFTLIPVGSYGGSDIYDFYDKMVLFYTEWPNGFAIRNDTSEYKKIFSLSDKFVKILTDCPFSVEYFNTKYNFNKLERVFFPINPKFIPEETEKTFDVYYTGHYFNSPIKFCFSTLNDKFNLCFVGNDYGKHSGCSYKQKIHLNSKSKISIVHGLLEWPVYDRKNVRDCFPDHRAFDLVEEYGVVPQIKTRTFEAAMSKSLILNFYDSWNLIESYFEPDEFLYWYDLKDLEEKIHHIVNNYEDYIPTIEKAYNRVTTKYTTQSFFEKYLRNT